jgi:hypothetical protein
MTKDRIRVAAGALLLTLVLFSSSCENFVLNTGGSGTLTGKITIGPLCPVERIPPDPACQPTAETYKAYQVSIWSSDMKVKIRDITPSLDGSYTIGLPTGTWMVALDRQLAGVGGSNLPVSITVKEGSDTQLDISIDTGIR